MRFAAGLAGFIALIVLASSPPDAGAQDWTGGSLAFSRALEELPPPRRMPIVVRRDEDGALSLSGGDCPMLERQSAALAEWKNRLHESAGAAESCRCASDGCSLRIQAAAPDFVNRYHGVKAGRWGPNCWNTALVSNKILSVTGFSSPEEMSFWMKSPLCRPLREGERAGPGDIVAIRDQSGQEVHGFVYLTEDLSFSKNYLTVAAAYALQSPQEVYGEFPVSEACRKPGAAAADCAARADYFRCGTWDDYLRDSGLSLPEEYARAAAIVSAADSSIHDLVFDWKTDPARRERAESIRDSATRALLPARELARGRTGLIWSALALHIESILHQISLAQ